MACFEYSNINFEHRKQSSESEVALKSVGFKSETRKVSRHASQRYTCTALLDIFIRDRHTTPLKIHQFAREQTPKLTEKGLIFRQPYSPAPSDLADGIHEALVFFYCVA
jgi:hypothetical protein